VHLAPAGQDVERPDPRPVQARPLVAERLPEPLHWLGPEADAPEGFAISPTGEVALAILLNGSAGVPKNAWFANKNGKVAVLKIDGKRVTKVKEIEVGGLPEGVVFSPDGKYAYVGNYTTQDVSILKIDGGNVTDTGKRFALPGHPASMRGRAR